MALCALLACVWLSGRSGLEQVRPTSTRVWFKRYLGWVGPRSGYLLEMWVRCVSPKPTDHADPVDVITPPTLSSTLPSVARHILRRLPCHPPPPLLSAASPHPVTPLSRVDLARRPSPALPPPPLPSTRLPSPGHPSLPAGSRPMLVAAPPVRCLPCSPRHTFPPSHFSIASRRTGGRTSSRSQLCFAKVRKPYHASLVEIRTHLVGP